ncbi:MAG: hypothetical protein JF592_05550 [Microbacterium sp.]|uniref:CHY zinc finger protein n=1 Tax=Microbacterium sp. TaxID=51671 RepID=UPI001D316E5C|nr:CHY zinc finger protein [Microbacterium sp.]MBW8762036.1 hypothetical protein [Microbacterium sp.]
MPQHPLSTPPPVLGPVVDGQTRCVHYRTELDIVAIRFACCGDYYPCHLCHAEVAGHDSSPWPIEARSARAVLCGVCGDELSIAEYLEVTACPSCASSFNPGCALHAHLYFEVEPSSREGAVPVVTTVSAARSPTAPSSST